MLLLVSRTSYRAAAFLEAGARLGLEVRVGSDHRQALADLSPAPALELDFTSRGAALAEIRRLASERPLRAVVAADDAGALLAAEAASALGLPGNPPEAVRRARLKHEMRAATAAAGIAGPAFFTVDLECDPAAAAARAPYPCVLKPVFLSASRGVIRADDPEAFAAAHRRIADLLAGERSPEGEAGAERILLVEEYLPGREVALEGLLEAGRLRTLAVLDKPDPLEGPLFEETILVTPSRLPGTELRHVTECVAAAARALGLRDGAVHAELRVHAGRASLLEIAPRSIGGLCSRVLRFEGDASLEEVLLRHATGLPGGVPRREARAAGVMMIPIPRGGTLRRAGGLERARLVEGIEDAVLTIPVGQRVVPLPEGHRYLGFLFARGREPGEVERALRAAHARLEIDID